MKQLAINFKKARIAKGLTQGVLSKKSGVMQCSISRYEQGVQSISIETAIKIAKAINDKELIKKITEYIINKFKS